MKKFLSKQKPEVLLFIISMVFLTFLGIVLSYNFPLKENYNLLFDSDTARVLKDATMIVEEHYRSDVHPLFILLVQPWVHLLSGIVLNKTIAIIIISSFVSSLSVVYIYKILEAIKPKKNANIVLALIYLFSFSNIIFTTGIETYNFAAFFLILLWYYFIKKEKDSYDKYAYILLAILGILNFSITITNVCVFLIILFFLWIQKKISIPTIIKIGISCAVIIASLSLLQKVIWQSTTAIWNFRPSNEQTFMEEKIGVKNIKEVISNDYYNSIMSSPVQLNINYGVTYNGKNYTIFFQPITIIHFILLTGFYILLIFLITRNFKKRIILNSSLLLTLGFNTALHIIYGNESTYLYSLHFLYIIILLLGINIHLEEDRRWKLFTKRFLLLFLGFQMMNNSFVYTRVLKIVKDVIKPNFFVGSITLTNTIIIEGCIILFLAALIILGMNVWKNKKSIISYIFIGLILLGIESIFIGIKSIEENKQFLKTELTNQQENFASKSKVDFLSKKMKETYKEEIKYLNDYLQELKEFKEENPNQKVENKTYTDYYYFGMGNRKKLIYKPGKLLDVTTKKEVLTFEEKEYLIIPNIYTVLIHTKDNSFIKIWEDEKGIHYQKDGKEEMLDETEINLYSFEDQKYQNMKKELYGEILFNIKDSTIYPNIIVYDKPWYRDAAITSMVLKETNNTDLIKDWVLSINEIYDKQNNGIEEPDNLGELLYILSTQEEKNEELIQKIEEEAKKIATENPDGYYLYGKTDFGDQYRYQNLWYKLGMESLGKNYSFDLDSIPVDNYTNMTWWINDTKEKQESHLLSNEYPYLSFAEKHTIKTGILPINENYYPLSYETAASCAKYDNYKGIDDYMISIQTSPLHTWSASEFLLYLLEETGNRQYQ